MGSSVIGRELSRDHAPDWMTGPEEAQAANQGHGHVTALDQSQSSP